MPLLEKAYAKFNINYLQLNGGNEIEALVALTGKPTATYDTADYSNDALFDLIHDADQKKYIMTGGCHVSLHNIVDGHAYTVIGALDLVDEAGTTHKLIQVRNPWAAEQYNGPWSDKDNRWTPALLKKYNRVAEDDGFFFMPVELYKKCFIDVTITYYADWHEDTTGIVTAK